MRDAPNAEDPVNTSEQTVATVDYLAELRRSAAAALALIPRPGQPDRGPALA